MSCAWRALTERSRGTTRARLARRVAMPVVATALATSLAGPPAWGHTFPPLHTVVAQVEQCELALLVGYTPGTGDPTERIVARAASQPKSHVVDTLRETLTAYAMAPLSVAIDGAPLSPTSVRAKIGFDAGGTRPMVIVLATYALGPGARLAITSKDPRTTRISWRDQASGRIVREAAPGEDRWFTGVASFLLPLAPGGSTCAMRTAHHIAHTSSDSSSDSSSRSR